MATPAAFGSSQARGLIGTRAAGLHHSHSTTRSKHICDLLHNSQQCQILNPLSEARDQTHILMDTSWVLNLLSHCGNSMYLNFKKFSSVLHQTQSTLWVRIVYYSRAQCLAQSQPVI